MHLPASLDGVPLRERHVSVQGVSLRVVEAGPADGPLVVLLHGFPEFWYGWRHQIPALARGGYRVLAPDQRGYGASGKPAGVGAYRMETLALDVVELIRHAGAERAHAVIGHDWGAAVAWWVAIAHPERLERLAVLNVPHPSRSVMKSALRKRPGQLRKSWYIFAFQLPGIPERLLGWRRGRLLKANLRGKDRSSFTKEDLERYREAWAQPGGLTGMLNWYRAMLRYPPRNKGSNRVTVPTLILWGEQDRYLSKELAPLSLAKCERGRLEIFPDATHWLQHDEAEAVNRELLGFLAEVDEA